MPRNCGLLHGNLNVRDIPTSVTMHLRRATVVDAVGIAEIYNWYGCNTIIKNVGYKFGTYIDVALWQGSAV